MTEDEKRWAGVLIEHWRACQACLTSDGIGCPQAQALRSLGRSAAPAQTPAWAGRADEAFSTAMFAIGLGCWVSVGLACVLTTKPTPTPVAPPSARVRRFY